MRADAPRVREIAPPGTFTAIFGDPVEHSGSPAMHNAAYAALKMNRAYLAFHVTPPNLAAAVAAIAALGFAGVNLTVPHKERGAWLVSTLSAEARVLGAVNCIINHRGKLAGDNTDARGLERDLRGLGVKLAGRLAIVIGAGGAGAAAVLACLRTGAARIAIANRTLAHGETVAQRLGRVRGRRARIETHGLDALCDRALLAEAALIVNATPMGLVTRKFAPLDYDRTARECFFYDMLYAAKPTVFLRPAIARSRPHADGAGMLVAQGELAFRLFNGVDPPRGVMRRALLARLGRK
jgi:shikimate dehydrogenase